MPRLGPNANSNSKVVLEFRIGPSGPVRNAWPDTRLLLKGLWQAVASHESVVRQPTAA